MSLKKWKAENLLENPKDTGHAQGWAKINFNDESWNTIAVPGRWQAHGLNFNGVVWFRKEVEIPSSWEGKNCTLSLGPCDKSDITWFNNIKVGSLSIDENPSAWNIPRIYIIPGNLIKSGKNVIAVRIYSHIHAGGFMGEPADMKITLDDSNSELIAIAGDWKCNVEHNFGVLPLDTMPQLPFGNGNPNTPYILFDNMIAPLIPFTIKGILWYQGESNAPMAKQYNMIFQKMIEDWRSLWQYDMPFYFVQLANYIANMDEGQNSPWAEIREAQRKTLELSNTGMAVTIDIGDPGDLHPVNKQDVAIRLALIAFNKVYGENVEYSGPIFEKATLTGDGDVQLYFSHSHGLHTSENKPLLGFSVAGKNNIFGNCIAAIDKETVLLKCSNIENPMEIRYGWSENPVCNLFNGAGLSASPFRVSIEEFKS